MKYNICTSLHILDSHVVTMDVLYNICAICTVLSRLGSTKRIIMRVLGASKGSTTSTPPGAILEQGGKDN